jgi:hypothetical protein
MGAEGQKASGTPVYRLSEEDRRTAYVKPMASMTD